EATPPRGLRAIRFTLRPPQLFRPHLRALWRASAQAKPGQLRIMLPMIAAVTELREAKQHIVAARAELLAKGVPVADESCVPVGIMLETPAAALAADRLARECDFFSIGTNDLIQYSLAIDRGNRDAADALVLLALGLDTLSMNPSDIPAVKRVLRSAELRDSRALLDAAMSFSSTDEIERFVHEEMERPFPLLTSSAGDPVAPPDGGQS